MPGAGFSARLPACGRSNRRRASIIHPNFELQFWQPLTTPPSMPPRLNLLPASRSLAFRPRPAAPQWRAGQVVAAPRAVRRCYADDASKKDLPESEDRKGPNTDTLPHVTEEARDMAKMRKMPPPEVEQGTPVDEVRGNAALSRMRSALEAIGEAE